MRALGGTNPEHITLEGITGPIVSYRGIPILKNDYLPLTQTKGTGTAQTTIFLVAMDEAEGLAGLMSANQEVPTTAMDTLLTALDELSIVGVRPKPSGLSASLSRFAASGARRQ